MKKIICLLLSVLMLVSAMAFVGCSEEPTLKMGVGVFVDVSKASNATADKAGEGKAAVTAAIITVDEDGKVVDKKKNKFLKGQEFDCLEPKNKPFIVKADTVYDEKDNEIESAPHPMMTIKIPHPHPVKKGSLLRMKAD